MLVRLRPHCPPPPRVTVPTGCPRSLPAGTSTSVPTILTTNGDSSILGTVAPENPKTGKMATVRRLSETQQIRHPAQYIRRRWSSQPKPNYFFFGGGGFLPLACPTLAWKIPRGALSFAFLVGFFFLSNRPVQMCQAAQGQSSANCRFRQVPGCAYEPQLKVGPPWFPVDVGVVMGIFHPLGSRCVFCRLGRGCSGISHCIVPVVSRGRLRIM